MAERFAVPNSCCLRCKHVPVKAASFAIETLRVKSLTSLEGAGVGSGILERFVARIYRADRIHCMENDLKDLGLDAIEVHAMHLLS